jgi:ubiquinone/menaquinone biosynthesis C-methylase UbiE
MEVTNKMPHKFDVKNKHKLDNEERRRILPPYETLIKLGLAEGDVMADIGCGIGYFSLPASEIVGTSGKVFALDVSPEMLHEVEGRASKDKIENITPVLTEENDLKIETGTITYGFVCNVLHETKDPVEFLMEIRRIVKDGGRIAIIEWRKVEGNFGPPLEHRLDIEYVKQIVRKCEFKNIVTIDIGEHFYAVIADK